ncbi:uncharacterized protein [Aristolochia californica]|uniref:uncharacterized protein n=1 Tax=Aristolochia californica TaxID=171875 RepID=UPI0035DD0D40
MFPRFALLPLLLLSNLLGFLSTAQGADSCRPSSCGNIRNISYPFRLKGDPIHCGDPLYELQCRNNQTLVKIRSRNYFVKQIFYDSQLIQIVHASLKSDLCSSIPQNFSLIDDYYYHRQSFGQFYESYYFFAEGNVYMLTNYSKLIVLVTCPKPIHHPSYIQTGICKKNKTSPASYVYTIIDNIALSDFHTNCDVVAKFPAPVDGIQTLTSTNIFQILLQGFELSWKEQLSCRPCLANHSSCIDYLVTKGYLSADKPLPSYFKMTGGHCIDYDADYSCRFMPIPLSLKKLLVWLACKYNSMMSSVLKYIFWQIWFYSLTIAQKRKKEKNSSQIVFHLWAYDQLQQGGDLSMGDAVEGDKDMIEKIILVALWCVQMNPSDCPSMSRVVEMLVDSKQLLSLPAKPFLSSLDRPLPNEENPTDSNGSFSIYGVASQSQTGVETTSFSIITN